MAERDARLRAAEDLTDTLHDWQGREGETDATLLTVAVEAHVQATLALVEEQATANLIAFYALGPQPGDSPDTWTSMRENIARRLGVHPKQTGGPW